MVALLQQYFSQSAVRFADKLAIGCDQESITFAEAEAYSNALARKIRQAGGERGSFVPFFMTKSVKSVLSILGILKADCAYVPIDINSPAQRLSSILQAANVRVMVVDGESRKRLEALLPATERPVLIDLSEFVPTDTDPLDYRNLSIDIAYVLFTSGSTGVPKGVMVSHGAVIDYIETCVDSFGLNEHDVISNHSPFYFDVSMFDLYTAFKTGASLHLVYDELNAVIPRLGKWLGEKEITTLFCVPSVLSLLLKSRRLKPDSFPALRRVICAGEVLPPDVLRAWMQLYPHIQFANMYGPTEITVTCSCHVFDKPPAEGALSVPIGASRPNMELFARLEDGSLSQQKGARGELLVRGLSVTYGYLGDAAKTAKAFIQNPSHSRFHDPLYCTGDMVEIGDAGEFYYLGRIDNQIKHMGYRIELGEIEAALVSIADVEEGVVVYGAKPGETESEIGVLLALASYASVGDIREQLKSRVPHYMVPTCYVLHQGDFPRTPSGKYDRKAVAALVFSAQQADH